MNRKQLILLIVIGVIVVAFGLNLSRKQEASWKESAQKMGEKLLPDFKDVMNVAEGISIKTSAASVSLAKKNDVWVVTDRGDYPANFGNLHDLLLKLLELKVGQPIRAADSQLARLELLTPNKGTNSGTLIELKDKSGKVLTSLLLGKKQVKESANNSPFGGGSIPTGRYVMANGSDKNIALVTEPFSNVEPKPEEWMDKEFLKVEKLKSIAVTAPQATNSWKLTRETENGEWKLADATGEEKLDSGKASGMNYLFSSPSFHDVATTVQKPEDTGMDKPTVAKLDTFDNFSYEVKVGKADPESHYFLKVATTADIAKERTPGKDEKPEDKEKLDKEFKEKTQKLVDKLKKEQIHDAWTYTVDKWTIENLLKERRELLADKKSDEKKDEGKTTPKSPTPDPLKLPDPLKPPGLDQ